MQSSFSGILATINRSSNHLIFGVASNTILRRTPREFETGDRLAVRSTWMGRASDLLRIRIAASEEMPHRTGGWPRNPRALAGRLRRCQTFLRTVGIHITFGREGRTGSRMIRMTSLTKSSHTNAGNGQGPLSEMLVDDVAAAEAPLTQLTEPTNSDAETAGSRQP